MLRRTILGASAFLAVVAAPLNAQDQAEACAAVTQSKVGYWAEYDLDDRSTNEVSSLRFAMIERPKEADRTWYEFQAATNRGDVIVQLDVPGWPFEVEQVTGVIVKMAGQPAMRLPTEMLAMLQQQIGDNPMADFADRCAASALLGTESLEVPAGTFSTLHIRSDDGGAEAWISPDVPFGIVKGIAPEGGTLILKGFGKDAISAIPEEPQTMPAMGGMNR
jgi:hypothetical protein